ncbi:MAG: dihydroneopterin aldolase [Geodermatophilaceae bacterium]|nr:dihydroneopterin aldolase [Geodermatophilaceae bacterium]
MTDRITLRGLRVRGYHGVFDHERRDGQDFVVDVVLSVDTSAAGRSDDLSDTIHYGVLAEELAADVARDPLNLIEALAQRLAERCLLNPRVEEVEVTVHKPQAPVTVPIADVTVTITRRQPARYAHNVPDSDPGPARYAHNVPESEIGRSAS